jgi:hypothetical protein
MRKKSKPFFISLSRIPLAIGLALFICVNPAQAGSELNQRESRYLKDSTTLAESILAKAAVSASGEESARISRMLTKLRSGAVVTTLVESDGLCAKDGYGGYVPAIDGMPAGNEIFLCKKAMRSLSHNPVEGAQIVLHELAHLDGAVSECDATFAGMNASAEAGLRPSINGYFSKCWPNGLRLGSAEGESVKLNAIGEPTEQTGFMGLVEREPAFVNGSLILSSRAVKKSPPANNVHSGCIHQEKVTDAR